MSSSLPRSGVPRTRRRDGRAPDESAGSRPLRVGTVVLAALVGGYGWGCGCSPRSVDNPFIHLRSVSRLAPAWAGSSINVSAYRQQSIVRLASGAHAVAYFDGAGEVRLDVLPSDPVEPTFVKPRLAENLLGDGHCSINLGRSQDGVVHVMYGAHGTAPYYAQVAESDLLRGGSTVTAQPWNRTITYPQFYDVGDGFELWFRADPESEIHRTRYDPTTGSLPLDSQAVLAPGDASGVYMNQLAVRAGTQALSFLHRLAPEGDLVRNEGLFLLTSSDGGTSWRTPGGAQVPLPSVRGAVAAFIDLPVSRQPLNQTASVFGPDGRLYLAWYATDASGAHQLFLAVVDDQGAIVEAGPVSDNRSRFDLVGRGTLVLPLSRPQLAVSERAVHVVYRLDDRLVLASRPIGDVGGAFRYLRLDVGTLGAWEPSISAETWAMERRLLVYVQAASQGPLDTAFAVPPEEARVFEFREAPPRPR